MLLAWMLSLAAATLKAIQGDWTWAIVAVAFPAVAAPFLDAVWPNRIKSDAENIAASNTRTHTKAAGVLATTLAAIPLCALPCLLVMGCSGTAIHSALWHHRAHVEWQEGEIALTEARAIDGWRLGTSDHVGLWMRPAIVPLAQRSTGQLVHPNIWLALRSPDMPSVGPAEFLRLIVRIKLEDDGTVVREYKQGLASPFLNGYMYVALVPAENEVALQPDTDYRVEIEVMCECFRDDQRIGYGYRTILEGPLRFTLADEAEERWVMDGGELAAVKNRWRWSLYDTIDRTGFVESLKSGETKVILIRGDFNRGYYEYKG